MQYLKEDLNKALKVLQDGGIILYPTDTIWGIGCDAANSEAVKRIYEIKKREDSKSMLVLIDMAERIPSYVREMPEVAWELIDVADKPLTIIYPGAKNLASNLINEDGTIGIRVSQENFTKNLINKFRRPIVSTSANISGQAFPANFDEISEEIKNAVDYIVEFRQDDRSKAAPSSIIKLGVSGEIKILR